MRIDGAPPLSVSLLQVWPTKLDVSTPGGPKGKSADNNEDDARRRRDAAAQERRAQNQTHPLIAGHLRIELDEEAGRFVQTLTDPTTHEILRRFPHESQLAFARAVSAYAMAQFKKP